MKHIWQSSQKHAPGSLDIAEDMPVFALVTDLSTILSLPVSDSFDKLVPVRQVMNPGNLKKYLPEPSSVGSPGRCAAPGQTLPLYMNQTSLDNGAWPKLSEHSNDVGIAVHGKTARAQSSRYQRLKELQQLRFRILTYTVLSGYKHMGTSIHQGNKTERTAQESAVKDEMLALLQAQRRRWRWLFQLVAYHFVKLSRTVLTLAHQLSYRVTFDNPQSEQLLLIRVPVLFITPPVGSSTRSAVPPLFPFGIMAVFPEYFGTANTEFFCS